MNSSCGNISKGEQPIYPTPYGLKWQGAYWPGLLKRQWLSAVVLQGLVQGCSTDIMMGRTNIATDRFPAVAMEIADALIKQWEVES